MQAGPPRCAQFGRQGVWVSGQALRTLCGVPLTLGSLHSLQTQQEERGPVCPHPLACFLSPKHQLLSFSRSCLVEVMRLGKRARLADKDAPKGGEQNGLWQNMKQF